MPYYRANWFFWVLGSVFLVCAVGFLTWGLRSFVVGLGRALNPNLIKPAEVVRFNLEKMKELKIPGI